MLKTVVDCSTCHITKAECELLEAARLEATRYMDSGDFQQVKIVRNGKTLFTMTLIKGSWI